ncbi:endonuclease [bacterium]|nr:endonuclease [bacterium]
MKTRILILLLTLFSFSLAEAQSIRVMTFNIRYNNPGDGINAWPNRKDHVADMFKKHKADLAGLQEALMGQIEDLEQRLPGYAWIGVGRDDGKKAGEFSPIFYRKNRFEVLQHDTFWLSKTPDRAGTSSWNSACNRVCTWGKFKNKQSGKVFYLFNTHLDHRSQEARDEGIQLIVKRTQKYAKQAPTVLTGDLNSGEPSFPIRFLSGKEKAGELKSNFKDAKYQSKQDPTGPTVTFTNWKELGRGNSPIDYIFVRNNVTVLEHTLDDKYEGYFPSDHLPVLAVVEIGG